MSDFTGSRNLVEKNSEAMVCMFCFQTKGPTSLVKDCKNPNCGFYEFPLDSLPYLPFPYEHPEEQLREQEVHSSPSHSPPSFLDKQRSVSPRGNGRVSFSISLMKCITMGQC